MQEAGSAFVSLRRVVVVVVVVVFIVVVVVVVVVVFVFVFVFVFVVVVIIVAIVVVGKSDSFDTREMLGDPDPRISAFRQTDRWISLTGMP